MSDQHRKPTAFRLDDPDVTVTQADLPPSEEEAEALAALAEVDLEQTAPRRPRRFRLGTLFFTGLGGLLSLAAGLAIDKLVRELFARADWLGWVGAALAALVVVAALALTIRELAGIVRLNRIDRLHEKARAAIDTDDAPAARTIVDNVARLYADRPDTARGRAAIAGREGEIIDGADLIRLAERDLLVPLDLRARRLVIESAKRVSVVTAVSPRALVDVMFVLAESLRLIRRVSDLYGGRPGGIGFARLARHVIGHLAVTGSIAVGDSVIQEMIGHGLAAKLSARLGEGVVNGLLTARIGIAAIDVCRPLPFEAATRPRIGDIFSELVKAQRSQNVPKEEKTSSG